MNLQANSELIVRTSVAEFQTRHFFVVRRKTVSITEFNYKNDNENVDQLQIVNFVIKTEAKITFIISLKYQKA